LLNEDVSVLVTRTSVINTRRVVTGRDRPTGYEEKQHRSAALRQEKEEAAPLRCATSDTDEKREPAPLRGARHRSLRRRRVMTG
jgi:hypothetical protein